MNILANYASSYVSALDVALSARSADTHRGEGKIEERTQSRLARLLFPAPKAEARAA
ncbi:MAG: hypothetical protein KF765_02370 [Parvibaculaceae bacterium]|nr:hypothetical protein [Parvibaculaceae bacterium]